jgi:transcription termination factor Rho
VDSNALERSALEGKDRDELVTIAQALGGKPAARAAKATIINLILELTGVSVEPAAAPAKATRAKKAAPKAAAAPAAVDDAPADDGPTDAVADPGSIETAQGAEDEAVPDDEPTQARPARDGAPQGRGQGGAPGQSGGQQNGGQQNGGQQNGGQQNGGQQNGGQQGQGGEDGDDEGANRRRRRRGRNRDRAGDPQGGGQPEEWSGEPVEVEGVVDLRDEGYGFLRVNGLLPSRDDAYISVKQARQFGLRRGDLVAGASRPALRNEKNPALLRIDRVNGGNPDQSRSRRRFDDLTPIAPGAALAAGLDRPVGRGQRAVVAGPHGSGKTELLKQVVRAVETGEPDVQVLVLLVDERPEEVTELRRWTQSESTQMITSTFDRPADEHAQVAELVIERAKRLVEDGADVVVVADGLTRLARAHNLVASTGRAVTAGVDVAAVTAVKRFLGAARNLEEGGSLTLVTTALVDTGSATDEVVYDVVAGAANLEIRLAALATK